MKLVSVLNRKLFIMCNKIKGIAKRTVTEINCHSTKASKQKKSAAQNMFSHKKIKTWKTLENSFESGQSITGDTCSTASLEGKQVYARCDS